MRIEQVRVASPRIQFNIQRNRARSLQQRKKSHSNHTGAYARSILDETNNETENINSYIVGASVFFCVYLYSFIRRRNLSFLQSKNVLSLKAAAFCSFEINCNNLAAADLCSCNGILK